MKEEKPKKNLIITIFLIAIFSTIALAVTYLLLRFFIFSISSYHWYERLLSSLLLFSEIFIFIHGLGYLLEITPVLLKFKSFYEKHPEPEELKTYPQVVVVVPSYHEPLEILRTTLISCYNLSYPKKEVWLLDDTRYELLAIDEAAIYKNDLEKLCDEFNINIFRRKWRAAKAGILNDFLSYLRGNTKSGFSSVINSKNASSNFKYIAVFDADQNPFVDFLEHLVVRMEKDPKIAFVQTPQYYVNFDTNRIARSSGLQQIIFFEYICEGKNLKEAMFCCGTNVLFKLKALYDVGGFDETSVTEDIATTFRFHMKKWKTLYYSRVGAFGLGPVDLASYFRQQFRWAFGTLSLFKKIIVEFFKSPRRLSVYMWWEYFLSTTYYLMGFVFLIMLICPVIYLLTGVPSYFAKMQVFSYVFLPYFLLTLAIFFWTLRKRGYKSSSLLQGQLLIFISLPVYIKAAFAAFFGKKGKFTVTAKRGKEKISLFTLWPQLGLALLCYVAIIWGINRMIFERAPIVAFAINIFWCIYNFFIMSSVIYFSKPGEDNG